MPRIFHEFHSLQQWQGWIGERLISLQKSLYKIAILLHFLRWGGYQKGSSHILYPKMILNSLYSHLDEKYNGQFDIPNALK